MEMVGKCLPAMRDTPLRAKPHFRAAAAMLCGVAEPLADEGKIKEITFWGEKGKQSLGFEAKGREKGHPWLKYGSRDSGRRLTATHTASAVRKARHLMRL